MKTKLISTLTLLMTVLPAWAQIPVSLSNGNDNTSDQDGYYYENMLERRVINVDK